MKISEILGEDASVGAISSASISTVINPNIANNKKKISTPKAPDGTAINALDVTDTSLFGGPIKPAAKK